MKYTFYLLCLSFSLLSCGKKQISVPGGMDLSAFELKNVDGSTSSYAIKQDESSNILEEGMITDGLQNGTWVTYHTGDDANKIKVVTNYVNGQMNGPYMEFNNRGQIEKRSTYLNSQIHGLYSEYKFGRPLKAFMYQEGILNGISKEYSDRGKLAKETAYKNGKLHGTIRQYDEEGSIILEYEYKDGEKISGGIVPKSE